MQTEIASLVLKSLNFFLLKKVGAFLIQNHPAILAGFFCIKPSILLATDPLTKTVLKVSLYYAYLLPNLNSIVQPSAICGGVKDETNISNGKTACS